MKDFLKLQFIVLIYWWMIFLKLQFIVLIDLLMKDFLKLQFIVLIYWWKFNLEIHWWNQTIGSKITNMSLIQKIEIHDRNVITTSRRLTRFGLNLNVNEEFIELVAPRRTPHMLNLDQLSHVGLIDDRTLHLVTVRLDGLIEAEEQLTHATNWYTKRLNKEEKLLRFEVKERCNEQMFASSSKLASKVTFK